jgi:DNA-binding MarR family transcriptional regulator
LGSIIRASLDDAGFGDLPVNGPYVVTATAAGGLPLAAIIEQLGLSKQAAGQLVDVLVLRGYLDRRVDPADRRRLVVSPTDRGAAAAVAVSEAAEDVESRLVGIVGASHLRAARETLAALAVLP